MKLANLALIRFLFGVTSDVDVSDCRALKSISDKSRTGRGLSLAWFLTCWFKLLHCAQLPAKLTLIVRFLFGVISVPSVFRCWKNICYKNLPHNIWFLFSVSPTLLINHSAWETSLHWQWYNVDFLSSETQIAVRVYLIFAAILWWWGLRNFISIPKNILP